VDSFEAYLEMPAAIGPEPYRAVFIRAPYITRVGQGVEILGYCDNHIVCVRQDRFLAAAFHPELTEDLRLHRYFLENAAKPARPERINVLNEYLSCKQNFLKKFLTGYCV